ncbi:hypothetical protein [Micromonospora sp. NPDC051141]|uniref:hypothetical protein n=1 Tax=Micromonospora sp. NPDC051141 TaxID=3364284 RepID=UPI0037BB8D75
MLDAVAPHVVPGCLCFLLAAHVAHYGTYQGILDETSDPCTPAIVANGSAWQTVSQPGRFDSEDPNLQTIVRLTNASVSASGSGYAVAPDGLEIPVTLGAPTVTMAGQPGRFDSEQPAEPIESPARALGTSGRLTVTKTVETSWNVEGPPQGKAD